MSIFETLICAICHQPFPSSAVLILLFVLVPIWIPLVTALPRGVAFSAVRSGAASAVARVVTETVPTRQKSYISWRWRWFAWASRVLGEARDHPSVYSFHSASPIPIATAAAPTSAWTVHRAYVRGSGWSLVIFKRLLRSSSIAPVTLITSAAISIVARSFTVWARWDYKQSHFKGDYLSVE